MCKQNEETLEEELARVAREGIADIEAGRYITISSPEDADALHERVMARLRARLKQEQAEDQTPGFEK